MNCHRLLLLLCAQLHPQANELVELVTRLEARFELGGALRQTASGEIRARTRSSVKRVIRGQSAHTL